MSALGSFLFAIAILFSIGLHELGHFLTAKRFGIKVEQFFIGFGPRLWSVRRGETEYGVKALPFGGFVRIAGMNPLEEIPPEDRDRVFQAKRPWQRAIVLGAGSFTHFIVALGIMAGVLAAIGEPDPDRPTTTIASVSAEYRDEPSPASVAGFRAGDRLVAVQGERVGSWDEATTAIRARPGQRTTFTVLRGGGKIELVARLASRRPDDTRAGFLGVAPRFVFVTRGPVAATGEAGKRLVVGMWDSLRAFGEMFSPTTIARLFRVAAGTQERSQSDPATVVGIGKAAGGLARSGNFVALFYLIAGVNIFIGVANLLPLPPLDGGHLAMLAWEKVTGRPVDVRKLLPVAGMVISIFGSLFLLLLYLDIVRPLPQLPG